MNDSTHVPPPPEGNPRYALPASPAYAQPMAAPARSSSTWVIVLLILLVVLVGLCVISSLFNMGNGLSGSGFGAPGQSLIERTIMGEEDAEAMAVIVPIEGVIHQGGGGGLLGPGPDMLELAKKRIDQAVKRGAKAIILEIDSPGGGVWASAWLHRLILRTKTDAKMPVIALFKNVAASGGYYIAAPADWIIAAPSTITGSIGVIMTHFNVSELAKDKLGVRYEGITSAAQKDILSPFRDMSLVERLHLKEMVQQMYDEFLNVVVEGRAGRVTREEVMALQSKIVTGLQAKEIGLVDEIGYLEEAFAKAKELSGQRALRLVRLDREPGLFDALFQAKSSPSLSLPGGGKISLEPTGGPAARVPFLYAWEGGL